MTEWFDHVFVGNPVHAYLLAAGYFIAVGLVLFILQKNVLGRLKRLAEKKEAKVDDFFLVNAERTLMPLLYFGAFYLSTRNLSLSASAQKILYTIGVVFLTFLATRFLTAVLAFLMREIWLKKETAENRARDLKILFPIMRAVLWGLALVFLLDNLGFKISTVIAGLGIGGIAVAMASQTVLGDLFAYMAILLDKPFELGDFVILSDGFLGTIEYIGIKTTRIRSLSGEQIIISNSDLTNHRVRNYKRMQERRVVFKLGVTYGTSPEKLEKAVSLVKDVITNHQDVRLDRAHFSEFGGFNLVIEVVYWVLSPDYNLYMDIQQDLNFAIQKAYAKEGIEFAFPTQTLYLHKEG
jgi:small-conductance mechanosensitive channel